MRKHLTCEGHTLGTNRGDGFHLFPSTKLTLRILSISKVVSFWIFLLIWLGLGLGLGLRLGLGVRVVVGFGLVT